MKAAALQLASGEDVGRNLGVAAALTAEAVAAGARLVVLPEMFAFLGRRDTDKLAVAEPDALDAPGPATPIQAWAADLAAAHGVALVAGSMALRAGDGGRVHNACLVWGPDGRRRARYDKLHLFAYDNGREHYDESATVAAGQRPQAVELAVDQARLRLGLSICYDLRFPELYRALMQPPCDAFAVPSAFTWTTGRAHWELLLRARAVENLAWVVAPAQGGTHPGGRRTWGHSMIVDPWGEVVACRRDEGPGWVAADLDPARTAECRRQLPALGHRRC